jgi:hypothetical protein
MAPAHGKTTAGDGLWGPFRAKPEASYEFVLEVPPMHTQGLVEKEQPMKKRR